MDAERPADADLRRQLFAHDPQGDRTQFPPAHRPERHQRRSHRSGRPAHSLYLRTRAGRLRPDDHHRPALRSEEHTSELQSLMRISYAVFCLKKKKPYTKKTPTFHTHQPPYTLTIVHHST